MAEVIIMPKLGFNMDEGELVKWCKKVGDRVEKGEVLFEINTDKTTMPVEATLNGVLLKTMLEEGFSADVFTPIAVIGNKDEDPDVAIANHGGTAPAALPDLAAPAPETAGSASSSAPVAVSTQAYDYDIVVIGGGPGGYEAAIKAAKEGKKTCLIEKGNLGGVCLNEGCIPTKTLIRTANIFSEIREAEKFAVEGVDASKISVNMKKLQTRKQAVVKQLVGGVGGLLRGNKITVEKGLGSFINTHTVQVGDRKITSEYFIIATGSEALIPSFIEVEGNTNILTSREALNLDYLPASVAVIGGGVIGIEFAYLLNRLGSKVTVIELLSHILPMVDEEVSDMARKRLEKEGVSFYLGAKVSRVQDNRVLFETDGKQQSVEADVVLMAVGRVPSSEGLNAREIGIEYDRSAIKTDDSLRTNIPNIYAIGDINAKVMLAHTASHEGMVAVENICGHKAVMDYGRIPSCIYLDPEIASIGMTEKQAREQYADVKVGRFPMQGNGKSLVEGDTDGEVKVIVDGELGEILGVHMYGKHVTDMIAEISVAMSLEATAEEMMHVIHPHPTVSESVMEAFMAVYGKAINWM